MISKHIDLIAIGFLLLAMAAFSGARHAVIMTMSGPVHYIRMNSGQNVKMLVMPQMPEVPEVPDVPSISLQRD